mmetsp:Transcript_94322/g.272624  ORF Transcript_94322/g.272624 Transcript_94322/m.272624 type:complete len:464 (-) Transcript_94322:164-1555(-)
MGHSLGRAVRISEWVFPAVPPSYDATHPLLVRFPVAEAGLEAAGILLGKDMLPEGEVSRLGSVVSSCCIFFHANGCDAGQCLEDMNTLRDGGLNGDAVVLAPEYPGYGVLREYEPSVAGINMVAQAAWRYCREELGFSASQIMIWGRSIGSGPATELAYSLATSWRGQQAPARGSAAVSSTGARPAERPGPRPQIDGIVAEVLAAKLQKFETILAAEAAARPPELVPEVMPEATTPAAREVFVGAEAVVLCQFMSDSADRELLQVGERGHVLRVDSAGDALINFEHHASSQWIFKSHLGHLHFEERPVGALCLLAPLTSVSDVLQHHIPSEFAGSLVGPMWSVLDRIRDISLERVPLLVIHPKQDEIVPSSHGKRIFEEAKTKRKFGIWLCNAMHNVPLEDEHFRIARPFLKEAVVHCAAIAQLDDASAGQGGEACDSFSVAVAELMELGIRGKAEELVLLSL